jgi:outer membrane receptor protein involved in Fe transport
MNFVKRFAVVLAVLMLISVVASAQTNSSLTGTVTLGGNPLPGATITISSPALQGVRTANSDVNGNYNFGAVPPGDYTVKFDMESMQSVTKTVHVTLSGTARADAEMKLTAVAEAITVTATAPAVLETTEIQANIPQTLVQQLPIARTLIGATSLAPGVNTNGPNGAVTINGAPSYETLFMVNGAVINENLRGQPHNLFIEDAIQETTVLSGAVSAEYGRFTGGVVNAITKSGGNEFTGSLRDSLTNAKWTSLNDQYYKVIGGTAPPRTDTLNKVYEATLGGRIIRDRLWFFLAGRQAKVTSPGSILRSSPALSYTGVDTNKRYEGKLTGQITPKHTLVLSYLDIKNPQTNNCFQSRCLEPSNLDVSRELPNNFKTVHYNGILTNSLLIEASYSKKYFAFKGSGGDFSDFAHGTWGRSLIEAGYFGAPVFCGFCTPEQRNNKLYGAKATYYLASKSLGTHNIVVGYDQWAEQRIANNYQSGSNFEVYTYNHVNCGGTTLANYTCFPFITSGDLIQYTPIPSLTKGSNFRTDSLYVNDKWDLNNHFDFNLGMRYDKNDGKDSSGNKVAKDSAVSPRLGIIYDVAGNGRYRFDASYSRYVSRIAETIGGAGSGAGNPSYIYYQYQGPDINTATGGSLNTVQAFTQLYAWFLSQGGLAANQLIVGGGVPGLTTHINGSLKSPHVDEGSFGFGSQLTANAFFRADYIHRKWSDFYSQRRDLTTGHVTDPFGNMFDVSAIENSNRYTRKYDGLDVQGAYRPWQRVNIGASYTYSKLKGNVIAETGGSGPITETASFYPEYKSFTQNNPIGYLTQDSRHRLRAWGSYDLPTRIGTFNFSMLQRFDSGTPYSVVGLIDDRQRAACLTCPANPGYVTPPTSVNYYFSGRGALRFQDITATDLAINYELHLSRVTLYVHPEMLNLFNNQALIGGDTTVLTARNSSCHQGAAVAGVPPASGPRCAVFDPFSQTPVLGVNYQLASTFGKPRAPSVGPAGGGGDYQLPRTYRIGFGVRF